ncbi:MAG: DUF805 domain-containing protein [Candidatus Riflebacteria bacterium HGW-Riflebacteria-2]|jgi:uncharacterized membrane protein YhaH (DUF805 family)|nr:MAG: DUF805 domain-containing protein [Candidatus Riflebacteria bacterium HGW-Riflebacteria-2]
MEVYMLPWQKFAVFSGRSGRGEYWTFTLVNLVISLVISAVAKQIGIVGILGLLFSLATLVPGLAVGIRRLHDTGKSGWYLLLALIPLLGWLALFIFMVQPSSGNNEYGAPPAV